jgi:hypothetical protein
MFGCYNKTIGKVTSASPYNNVESAAGHRATERRRNPYSLPETVWYNYFCYE